MKRDRRPESSDGSDEPSSPSVERVELPEHASAYYSPKPPPAVSKHKTIETEPVRFDPSVDPAFADTQRISTDSASTGPFELGPTLEDRDADTVLMPVARRRRWVRHAGIAAGCLVVVASFAWSLLRDGRDSTSSTDRASNEPSAARATPAATPIAVDPASEPDPASSAARPADGAERGDVAVGERSARAGSARPSAPAARRPEPARPGPATREASPSPAASAPKSWLGSQRPKSWVK